MKKRLQEVVDYIESIRPSMEEFLGLQYFDIEVVYLESYFGDDGEEDFKVTATTEGRWQYRQAKIKFYLLSAVRHSDEELAKVLMHEYCHVLLLAEQSLVDARFAGDSAKDRFTESEHGLLVDRNYELLEMATENVTRPLYEAWKKLQSL